MPKNSVTLEMLKHMLGLWGVESLVLDAFELPTEVGWTDL